MVEAATAPAIPVYTHSLALTLAHTHGTISSELTMDMLTMTLQSMQLDRGDTKIFIHTHTQTHIHTQNKCCDGETSDKNSHSIRTILTRLIDI